MYELGVIPRLRKFLSDLGETFWVLPGLMVVGGILGAVGSVYLDRSDVVPQWLNQQPLALQRRRHRRAKRCSAPSPLRRS